MFITLVRLTICLMCIGRDYANNCKALKPEADVNIEREVNAGMLERVLYAVEKYSDRLKFVLFPSGTRVSEDFHLLRWTG